jgi:hypothetical protein
MKIHSKDFRVPHHKKIDITRLPTIVKPFCQSKKEWAGAVGGITGALIGMAIPEYEAKTVRRPPQRRRYAALRPLRQLRVD